MNHRRTIENSGLGEYNIRKGTYTGEVPSIGYNPKDTQNKEKGKTSEQEQQTQKQKRRHSATRTNLPTQQHTIPVYSTAGVKTSVPGIITPY